MWNGFRLSSVRGLRGLFDVAALAGALVLVACTPQPEGARECTFNRDCTGSLVCAGGYCRAACADDRDCVAPQRCVLADDPSKTVCAAPMDSHPVCSDSHPCGQGYVCANGSCTQTCSTDMQCAPPAYPSGYHCSAANGQCVPSDQPFTGDAGMDASTEASADAGMDASVEASADAGMDAGTEASADAGTDASADAVPDVVSSLAIAQIAAGAGTTCVRMRDGTVKCWGRNYAGEVGDGTTTDRFVPTTAVGLSNVVQLAGSPETPPTALRGDGTIVVIGTQLTEITAFGTPVEIAVGSITLCARSGDGTVQCMGRNDSGQLGNGMHSTTPSTSPTAVMGLTNARQLALGYDYGCALRADGTVVCWGNNARKSLGPAGPVGGDSPVPLAVTGLDSVVEIASGAGHVCARKSDGTVWCWGANTYGSADPTSRTDSATPKAVGGVTNAVQLAMPWYASCARIADGSVTCWGDGNLTPHGDGQATGVAPSRATGITDAIDLAAGDDYACAVHATGTVSCWGNDQNGQLGNGVSTLYTRGFRPVPGFTNVDMLAGGGSAGTYTSFLCAATSTGNAQCMGANASGQLGNGSTNAAQTPSNVSDLMGSLSMVRGVAAGSFHACAWLTTGGAACWGDNSHGQIGDGNGSDPRPRTRATVVGGTLSTGGVASIVAGDAFSCALRTDGTVACWGDNSVNQLGPGSMATSEPAPVDATGVTGVTQLAAGWDFVCALLNDGTVTCWGNDAHGQLGDGVNAPSATPMPVAGITNAVQIAAGTDFACARLGDGSVRCWGSNEAGQLGPLGTPYAMATVIADLNGSATDITAGSACACVRLSTGATRCWGDDRYGCWGDPAGIPSSQPTLAPDPAMSAFGVSPAVWGYRCVIMTDSTVQCTGAGPGTGFGDQASLNMLSPVPTMGLP